MQWLYERNADNSARFVLGTVGEKPLVCFGINPSTAEPNHLDRTVNIVSQVAALNGFDSFVMLNVYAQRSTDPDGLDECVRPAFKNENERQIAAFVGGRNLTLWGAWGHLVELRGYLPSLLQDIVALPEIANCSWVSRGRVTKGGHPHHPLYVKKDAPLEPFNVDPYR